MWSTPDHDLNGSRRPGLARDGLATLRPCVGSRSDDGSSDVAQRAGPAPLDRADRARRGACCHDLGFNVLFAHTASRNANSLLRARASSELGLLELRGGRLHVLETSDDALGDSQVWIFDRRGPVERPRRRTASDAVAAALAGGSRRFDDVRANDIRLYATPIVIGGRRQGTLVTGISLAPYEQTQRTALIGSLALAGLMLGVVGIAVFLLLRSALRPVARMTQQAASWSEHDLDRRFDLGEPHDELTQLGATLDGLLDRLAASLRHERRFSAEVSHELRTPLARLIGEAELALRRERTSVEYRAALELVLSSAQQVARIVDALVAAARHEAETIPGTADAYAVLSTTTTSSGPGARPTSHAGRRAADVTRAARHRRRPR